MLVEPELLLKIKKRNHGDVESEWVARADASPRDLAWFVEVARELRAHKAHVLVADLVTYLVDTLAEAGAWEEAFGMLREGIALVPRNKELRAKAAECFRTRYSDRGDLEEVFAFFGLEEADDPVRAFEEMREWLRFDVGENFFLFGRGLAKVVEVNLPLQKVKLRFEKTAPLVVRRDEARKLLTWIPPDHFMSRRVEDPEAVRAEVRADPGEALRQLLECFGRPLTAAEIRECMTGVVEGGAWNSWWAKARSHPQVLPAQGRRAFEWSGSSEEVEQRILEEFRTAAAGERLAMARRFVRRGGAVKQEILRGLVEELERIAPSRSARAVEIAFLLEELGGLPEPSPLSVDGILCGSRAVDVITGVADRRYRERLYHRLREVRPDDWAQVYSLVFFGEKDFRLMSALYEALREGGHERVAEKLVADSVATPRKTPWPFVWVTKNVLVREELRGRANHSLLSKILDALDAVEFKDLRSHLREHFEAGGIAFAVFDASDREGADHLLNLIDSASSLEDHRKIEIRRAIFRKYPHIRSRADEDDVLYVTAEAVEAKRREFEQLVRVEIPENTEAIRVARGFGDLSENFEYHAARQKHEVLSSRATRLQMELRKIRLIDPAAVDPARVGIGTCLDLEPLDGGPPRSATILGPWDSDPDRWVFSYQSAFAKGILGKRVHDTVSLGGVEFRITGIRPWRSPGEPSPPAPAPPGKSEEAPG